MRYNKTIRFDIIKNIINKKPGKVLEIGCNSGDTISYFNKIWPKFNHLGIDINNNIEYNNYIKKIDIINGINFIKEKYDYILLLDVIEHIKDQDTLHRNIHSLMNKDSKVIFSIPNIRFINALLKILILKNFPDDESGIFDITHVKFFTKKKIIYTLLSYDYNIIEIKGINSIYSIKMPLFRKIIYILIFPIILFLGLDTIFQQYYVVAEKK